MKNASKVSQWWQWFQQFQYQAATLATIYELKDKFEGTRSVMDATRTEMPDNVTTEENQLAVAQAVLQSLWKSTWNATDELGFSQRSVEHTRVYPKFSGPSW